MMRSMKFGLGLACAALVVATPAAAGWKLVPGGQDVVVAKTTLSVAPSEQWNRASFRPVPKSEVWSLDSVGLNELYFVSGLIVGETLYRDAKKKDRPLPRMTSSMQLTDIPDFFESSQRVGLNTSAWDLTGTQPARLAGHDAIRFSFRYAVQGNPVYRKGVAVAALVGGKLTLISFIAPETFYFDRDLPKAEAIIASAKF